MTDEKCFGNNCIFFLFIVFCDPAITCNDKGICYVDGTCKCDPSFYGDNCTSKLRKLKETYLVHFKINNFSFTFFIAGCHDFFTCSDHGSCSDVGICQCVEGFYGENCSSKLSNL